MNEQTCDSNGNGGMPLPSSAVFDDPTDDPEYHKWVAEQTKYCRCEAPWPCPCDGVLAGGICDGMIDEPDYTMDDLEWHEACD